MSPQDIQCVIPSRVGVGESFTVKVRVLGDIIPIGCVGQWCTRKPALHGPFNLNVQRGIQYHDNCLPEWTGVLQLDGGGVLDGPERVVFDGKNQGVFAGDTRPILTLEGLRWTQPGFRFLKLIDPKSGIERWSNPAFVTPDVPRQRIYWGDPHWQTFFSDGIRCPEELYAFARDEGFLDFGAITDHVEALTDRQWDYFIAVTNDYNQNGRFATLVGEEWTKHHPGHRNIYFRGDYGPILRCTDPRYDSLDKLWQALDGFEAIAIPHHSANKIMGVDWSFGWEPRFEKAVEIYSVWGNSERPGEAGNPRPIRHCQGEVAGRHVLDALRAGYRFGFVGGGDIHCGRPGDALNYIIRKQGTYPQGLTAALAPELTRENIYDAIRDRRTYATTCSRIYLETDLTANSTPTCRLTIKTASEEGIREAVLVRGSGQEMSVSPEGDPRIVETTLHLAPLAAGEFCYVRVTTGQGNMAWSTPYWG